MVNHSVSTIQHVTDKRTCKIGTATARYFFSAKRSFSNLFLGKSINGALGQTVISVFEVEIRCN